MADEWEVDTQEPDTGNQASEAPETSSQDEWEPVSYTAEGAPESSAVGAFGRSALRGFLPNTAAGLAGNIAGVGAGAALAETGPGAVVGGLAAAGAVATGVGYAATRAQNELMKKLGLDLEPQETADVTQHPYASEAGNLASMFATFNIGGIETKLASRAITGGVISGIDLAQQVNAKGISNVDPTEAAIAGAGGAMFGGTRKWARGSEVIGTQLGNAIRGRPAPTVQQGGVSGRPNQPQADDAQSLRTETDNANDVTAVAIGATNDNVAETHQPDVVQPQENPAATIDVIRSDTDYKKGAPREAEGVEGAPSTEGIIFDDAPAPDVQAALGMTRPEPAPAQPAGPLAIPQDLSIPPFLQRTPGEQQPPIPTGLAEVARRQAAAKAAQQPAQPPMRDVQVIRHGATDMNNDDVSVDRLRGWTDVPLSQGGLEEADKVGLQAKETPPNNIFTSDLNRAHETAKIISNHTGVPINNVMPELRPWNVGDLAGMKSSEGIPILADLAENHPNTPAPGKGESFNQFKSRFFDGLEHILDNTVGKPALVIHHRGERLLEAWKAAGYPANGDIDIKTFNQKGEPTGKLNDIQLPPDRVKAAAQALREQAQQPVEAQPVSTLTPETVPESGKPTDHEQQILDSLKNLEGGEEAANALAKTTGEKRTAAFEKAAQAVKNAPEKRAKVGEVQTGGGARGARKTAATNAVKDAYEKFAPAEDEDDQGLLDRLKQATDYARQQYGGKNPVDRKEGYAPRVKPPEWQFIKKAQDLLRTEQPDEGYTASPEQIEKFRADESMLRSGGAADVQATKRITADIERKQQPTSEVAEAAGAAEPSELPARQDFDLMEPWKPGADESKQYIDQSNDLRTWINGLEEGDYNKLAGAYPEMKQVVETAGDPHRLQLQMESDLEGAQMKAAAPEPVSPKPPVSTIAEKPLATEPGAAATTGVSRKDLIAEYNRRLQAGELPGGNKLSPEERLAAEQKAQAGTEPTAPPEEPEPGIKEEQHELNPVSGEDDGESAESTLQKFISDKSGAVNLGAIQSSATGFKNWLNSTTRSEHFMAASSKSPLETAARDTAEALHVKTQRLNDWKGKLLKEGEKIPDTITAKDQTDMFRAMEQGKVATLPPQQQAVVREILAPMRYYNQVMYEGLRKFDPNLPELSLDHMPRRIVGRSEFDEPSGQSADPIEGIKRVMSTEPPSLKDRNYMALEDTNGKRFVVEPDAPGRIKVWHGGKYKIYKAPAYEPTIGKQIDVAGKQYTVQDAYAQQITRNVLANGKPVQYHENAFGVLANESARLFDALQNVQFLEGMKSDPRFVYDPKTGLGGATTDADIGREMGWSKSKLPQFKEWFMDPAYRQVFDDYAKPGLGGGATVDWIRNLGQAALKTMFWLPTAHLNNVFQHWIVGRGSNWFTIQGYRNLAQTLPQAIKSVMTQDATQSALRGIGEDRAAGTVYGGVMTKDFTQRIAELGMMDMQKNPSAWDPIIRPLGIPLPEFAKVVYRASSKIMWAGNDMMLTQLYLENKMNGMSHNKAIVEAERHFPNYRLPATIMGSRAMQEVFAEPLLMSFGRYHFGMMNSYGNIAKDLVAGNRADRTEAMAKIVLLGIMGFVAYPVLDQMAQYVTGNKQAYAQPRGPMAIPMHIKRALQGKEDIGSIIGAVASTPPLMSTLNEVRSNTDWRGKKIVPPSTLQEIAAPNKTLAQRAKGVGAAIVQEGEHAARGLINPIQTAEEVASNPRGAATTLAARLAEIKNPSPAATKFLNRLPATLQKERRERFKKPPGMAEKYYNQLVGQ